MSVELLTEVEILYFQNLHKKYKITQISVEQDGVTFKDEELQAFMDPNDSPEMGLEKFLELNKVTSQIYQRIRFNYLVKINNNLINLEFY